MLYQFADKVAQPTLIIVFQSLASDGKRRCESDALRHREVELFGCAIHNGVCIQKPSRPQLFNDDGAAQQSRLRIQPRSVSAEYSRRFLPLPCPDFVVTWYSKHSVTWVGIAAHGRAFPRCYILRVLFERRRAWLASKVFRRSRCRHVRITTGSSTAQT